MNKRDLPPSLKDLGARLRKARHRKAEAGDGGNAGAGARLKGVGFAFRIGTELVSALVVGVGIGLLIDHWLDTGPWGLVVFFFLGAGAGILNVYRAMAGYGMAAGYRKPEDEDRPPHEDS